MRGQCFHQSGFACRHRAHKHTFDEHVPIHTRVHKLAVVIGLGTYLRGRNRHLPAHFIHPPVYRIQAAAHVLAIILAAIKMADVPSCQFVHNVIFFTDFMLALIGNGVARVVPTLNHRDAGIQVAQPRCPHIQRNFCDFGGINHHHHFIHFRQGGFNHILMPLVQRGKFPQGQTDFFQSHLHLLTCQAA